MSLVKLLIGKRMTHRIHSAEDMTTKERLRAVAAILANGVMRLRKQQRLTDEHSTMKTSISDSESRAQSLDRV